MPFRRLLVLIVAAAIGAGMAGLTSTAVATPDSQFDLDFGAVRNASGTPRPESGTEATLWANRSSAGTTIEGAGSVIVGVRGEWCRGWPVMRVEVDGVVLGTAQVTSERQYIEYTFGDGIQEGVHRVEIRMINDRYEPPACDRNLHLSFAEMSRVSDPTPPPTTTTPAPPAPPAPPTTTTPAPPTTTTPVPPPTTTPAPPTTTTPAPPTTTAPTPTPPAPPTTTPPPPPTPPGGTGVPGPDNTGVPDGTVLTPYYGNITVTQDGTVIDGLDVYGFVDVRADNVTIRNSVVRGTDPGTRNMALVSAYGDHVNLQITDTTLVGAYPSPYLDGLKGRNFTATRLDISNVVDTVLIFGDNATVQDSWLHGNTHFDPDPRTPDGISHDDNIQIEGGSNITIRGNTLEGAFNAAVQVTQNYSRTQNVAVLDNAIAGGWCSINLSEKDRGPIRGFIVRGNEFGPSAMSGCGVIAPPSSPVQMVDNVYAGTELTVGVRRGA